MPVPRVNRLAAARIAVGLPSSIGNIIFAAAGDGSMTPEPVFLTLAHQAPKEQKPSEPKHLRPARPYATNALLKYRSYLP